MSNASFAVQQALYSRLATDAGVVGLLGGPRVYDDVPVRAEFPYISFGQTTERDWSTGGEEGSEHIVTLHVWSRAHGRKEADEILAAARSVLHDAPLPLSGHHLVNLRHEFSDARRDPDGETYHGTARFRAVTEPA